MIDQVPAFGRANPIECDEEPIRVPGSIQPHGVLLAVDPLSMRIVQIAGETQRLLGQPHDRFLGQSLDAVLGTAVAAPVELMTFKAGPQARPFSILRASFDGRPLLVSRHLSGGLVVLELEPCLPGDNDPMAFAGSLTSRMDSTHTTAELLHTVAAEVAMASGFDRVAIYCFREDYSGHVVAEHRRSAAVESLMGLRYPESDIPAQARDLYRNNWIRSIPNASYSPAPLDPPNNPMTGEALDLTYSALRSISPSHLEYLHNMGVAASMSLSLMVNGKLWGLVICHHGEPRYLDARTRAGLEICAQLASLQITSNAELAEAAEYGRARQVAARMLSAMIADGVGRLLTGEPNALNLIPAAGAALMVRGELTLLGQTPTTAQIRGVVQWLTAIGEGVYATDRLRDHYPPAAGFLNTASGLLALSISDPQRDYLLWFLPELVSEVTWAGDPARPMSNRLMGVPPKPRKSFAAWIETVRGRARPWSRLEKKTADAIRIALLELVAPQIDGRVGQPGDPAGDDPDPVMAELEHRVNTALASIQAATRLSNRSADATIDYVRALEHRIGAMAKSHGPLTAA